MSYCVLGSNSCTQITDTFHCHHLSPPQMHMRALNELLCPGNRLQHTNYRHVSLPLPFPASDSCAHWAPSTCGPTALPASRACCGIWAAATAPGVKDTPNSATQVGQVRGRCMAMESFRHVASSMRPVRGRCLEMESFRHVASSMRPVWKMER